jgi:hypothetical protein
LGQEACASKRQRLKDQNPTRKPDSKPSREPLWRIDRNFQGWICSACEWNDPIPTLLNDPDAKTAYDRLAIAKFRTHDCANHAFRMPSHGPESFTLRIRKLISRGFKPKDAVELVLQEVSIEAPGDLKLQAQAEQEAEDFLRRLRAGLI